jgi:hypothetical protein
MRRMLVSQSSSEKPMAMDAYSHVIPELRRQAADRMDELINER